MSAVSGDEGVADAYRPRGRDLRVRTLWPYLVASSALV